MEKVKEKKKSKGKTVMLIIICVLIAAVIGGIGYMYYITRPSLDTEPHYAVGGMVYSDTVEYRYESGKGIKNNPIIKVMQVVWRFCQDSDAAVHAEQTPPSGVEEVNNIAYIDDGNIYHLLDVYYPEGATPETALPMIVDIHGGGWIYGDKELNKYYCLELASKGYVVFNISYRLVPDVTVNEQIQDCMAALNWVNENYGAYTSNVSMLLTGDSAGGMFASYTAAIMNSAELQESFSAPYSADGIQPKALLLTSPVTFMKSGGMFSLYTKVLWGSDYKTKGTYDLMDIDELLEKSTLPPSYLITSDGDSLAHDQTFKLYELLQEKGIEAEIKNFGNDEKGEPLPHVFSVLHPFDQSGQEAINAALEFYKQKEIKE